MLRCFLLVTCCSLASPCLASEKVKEQVEATCQKIAELPLSSEWKGADMWGALIQDGGELFHDMIQECQDEPEVVMKTYLDAVLERPPEEAFRLLLAAEDVLLPIRSGYYHNQPDNPLRPVQIAAAKIEIELMKDPEIRAKLYRMVAWRGHYVGKDFVLMSSMDIGKLANNYQSIVN